MVPEFNGRIQWCQPSNDFCLRKGGSFLGGLPQTRVYVNALRVEFMLMARLPDLLNHALGSERFHRQVFRDLRIELWQKQRTYPRQHLEWTEGQTEVDVVLTWENSVFESPATNQNNGFNSIEVPCDPDVFGSQFYDTSPHPAWHSRIRLVPIERSTFSSIVSLPKNQPRAAVRQ